MMTEKKRGMKWYKFVIYVQLFAAAVLSVANAVMLLTGTYYNSIADTEYEAFRLGWSDMVLAILYVALAAYCVFARQRMAEFKKGARLHYNLSLGIGIVLTNLMWAWYGFLYSFIKISSNYDAALIGKIYPFLEFVFGEDLLSALNQVALAFWNIPGSVVSIVLLIVSLIYFGKRKDMFGGEQKAQVGDEGVIDWSN